MTGNGGGDVYQGEYRDPVCDHEPILFRKMSASISSRSQKRTEEAPVVDVMALLPTLPLHPLL